MAIHELITYLRAKDARKAIDFYKSAFGAEERFRLEEPDGRVGHAELTIGAAEFYISDEFPEMGVLAPDPSNPARVTPHLHVDDADALVRRAAEAGATVVREPTDQFYGERSGTIRDPVGYDWLIGHSIEDVSPEDMQQRYDELLSEN